MRNSNFTIRSFKGGYDSNFTYLVSCEETGTQIIVDAALPLNLFKSFIHSRLSYVLLTHTHVDHLNYLKELVDYYPDIKVVAYADSENKIRLGRVQPVLDNDQLKIGNLSIDVLHTPGHYHDSLCYKLENVLFTGDTLFVGRTGRTLSAGSSTRQLYRSVYTKLLTLRGSTIIYPGHNYGSKTTITIKENIRISPLLQATDEQDFVRRMAEYEANR